MNNLADRIAKHLDDYALDIVSEYTLALNADFEIHSWLKEQETQALKMKQENDIKSVEDLLKWLDQTNKKGGQ